MKVKLLPYLILGLMAVVLPLTLVLVRSRQELRKKAAEEVSLAFDQEQYTVNVNSPVLVNLNVNTAGKVIAGAKIVVKFDPTILQAVSISKPQTNPFLPLEQLPEINNQQGIVSVYVLSAPDSPPTGTGTVATIQFAALKIGTTQLNIDPLSVIVGVYDPYKGIDLLAGSLLMPASVNITGSGILNTVVVEPPQIIVSSNGNPVGVSALAYDYQMQPIWAGVTYEWGLSSTNSIGTLLQLQGNITQFDPQNIGSGDIWVIARQNERNITRSISVTVTAPAPTPTPSTNPTPTLFPTSTPKPTVTPTPVSTPTSIPSATPTPTPTPPPATVIIKVKFEGVHDQRNQDQFVEVNFGGSVSEWFNSVRMRSDNNGVFSNNYPDLNQQINNLPVGIYDIFVSGPVHLSKRFSQINIQSGNNLLELTQSSLLTGDIIDNNLVDLSDFNRIVENFGCSPGITPAGKDCTVINADLDIDGDVDVFDYAFLVGNFSVSGNQL